MKEVDSFGNLFGLHAIFEDDDGVRVQVGDQAENSGSVEVSVKNWHDQVD